MTYNSCSRELTKLKKELEWLQEPDAHALQASLQNLDMAFQNFFRKVKLGDTLGYPRFKSKKNRSMSYTTKYVAGNNIQIVSNFVKLPKLGSVKFRGRCDISGRILNATISQVPSGKYYCSICCTDVEPKVLPITGNSIGLDLGINKLITTSNGKTYKNHRHLKQYELKLANAQRVLSRKVKGSKNWNKARIKVAKIYEKITNQRYDTLHKVTSSLVNTNDIICIEDLDIQSMKTKYKDINKSIYDTALGELVRQLEYKCEWYGRTLQKVDRYYPSSTTCNNCGNRGDVGLRLKHWTCDSCGIQHHRDYNAAKNILKEGLRLIG